MITHEFPTGSKTLIITLSEDLISTTVESHRKEIFDLLGDATSQWDLLEVDLTGVRRMDSVGLNLIVGILNEVRNRNAKMRALVREGNVRQAFLFTRLDHQIEVVVNG